VRIVKALKEGKDPNESNPKPQPTEEPLPSTPQDGEDEQQANTTARLHHATVEEVPEEHDQFSRDVAMHTAPGHSLHPVPSPAPSKPEVSPRDEFTHTEGHDGNVSPLESSQSNDRSGSVGGGFFPLPTFTSEPNDSTLPTAPPSNVNDLGLPNQPSFTPGSEIPPAFDPPPTHPSEPQDYYRASPPQVQPSPLNPPYTPAGHPNPQPPQNTQQYTSRQYPPPIVPYQAPTQPAPLPSSSARPSLVEVDDEAIAQAQKHARWAISALNFEDTKTAIRELRDALKTLGAA
jgi:vacuolar protein sorting-associated protein VTA1